MAKRKKPTTNIEYKYFTRHKVINDNGSISYSPAIPNVSALYVILNLSSDRYTYIGTAGSMKERFKPRASAMREMGFDQDQVGPIKIYQVKPYIHGAFANPGDGGVCDNIDLEHLLIRIYLEKIKWNVRNVVKTARFTNNTGAILHITFVNNTGANLPSISNLQLDLDYGESL